MADPAQPNFEEQFRKEFEQAHQQQQEPEPQPEPQPEPETEPEPQSEPPAIPYAKYRREEEKRKEAEERAERLRAESEARYRLLEERLQALNENLTKPQEAPKPEDPEPDRRNDVEAWLDWKDRQYQQGIEEIRQRQQQFEQWQQQEQMRAYAQQALGNQSIQEPLNHLRQVRAQELKLWGATDDQVVQQLQAEEGQMVAAARQAGRPVQDIVTELARLRGYQPAPPPQEQQRAPNGQYQQQPSVAETRTRGQQASEQLGAMSGGAPEAPLSLAALEGMDDSTFEQLLRTGKLDAIMRSARG